MSTYVEAGGRPALFVHGDLSALVQDAEQGLSIVVQDALLEKRIKDSITDVTLIYGIRIALTTVLSGLSLIA